jgi:hypothetical protein
MPLSARVKRNAPGDLEGFHRELKGIERNPEASQGTRRVEAMPGNVRFLPKFHSPDVVPVSTILWGSSTILLTKVTD